MMMIPEINIVGGEYVRKKYGNLILFE